MPISDLVFHLVQGLLSLLIAPLLIGVLRLTRARLARCQGPRVLQPYYDLRKLFRKRSVPPAEASWVFDAAPIVVFTCYAMLGFLAPSFYIQSEGHGVPADLIVLIYLLGLARLAAGLAGFAAGAPFGGLGASREMFIHVLVEPALIAVGATLALRWHTTDLAEILRLHMQNPLEIFTNPALLLLIPALWVAVLNEAGRLPYDNHATNLELTMLAKAIEIEYSGPQLALLEWARWARLGFLLTMLGNLILAPSLGGAGLALWRNLAAPLFYLLRVVLLAGVLGVYEGLQAKARLRALPAQAAAALVIALIAAVLAIATA